MKKFCFIILIFGLISCSRNQPDSLLVNLPSVNLKLIESFKTNVPEPSGLFYNKKTESLFTVSDGNSTVYEIDFYGKIKNSFSIQSTDLEGISFSENCDTMYVVEEQNKLVTKYLSNGTKLYSFSVNVATVQNNALEGIAIDNRNAIYVLNEKLPNMLLKFSNKTELFRKEINYTKDCSDICYDKDSDCLWMVSDESQKVIKMSKDGNIINSYNINFSKGEGITIYQNKIYIISDYDGMMYVFEKP
ncbi:MAG: SdiA-regulated domain-containing protein [Melioribacteraceae bacterium]|nr:SdiA-regulated domain-containing protein [Melioribacteraceae bacterium]